MSETRDGWHVAWDFVSVGLLGIPHCGVTSYSLQWENHPEITARTLLHTMSRVWV